jgi:hypothetical protein
MNIFVDLNRSFSPIPKDHKLNEDNYDLSSSFGLLETKKWSDLLLLRRVIILAEAGAGKTEEIRVTTKRLRNDGNNAFFFRLEHLSSNFEASFEIGTNIEFEEWLSSDESGYFFLDSVDEARLCGPKQFELAIRNFGIRLGDSKQRTHIFITSRLSEWRAQSDLSLIKDQIPFDEVLLNTKEHSKKTLKAEEASFSNGFSSGFSGGGERKPVEPSVFSLCPLDQEQIKTFSQAFEVQDLGNFLRSIERAEADIFSSRPLDLVELINYWTRFGKLANRAELIKASISSKLEEPDPDRATALPLNIKDARLGAEMLAAAVTLQKKDRILVPEQNPDSIIKAGSIDIQGVLTNWSFEQTRALLQRPIFDEAVYGTVRFHHRTVREYLMSTYFKRLINEGKSRRLVEGLLFRKQYGRDVFIPSMRSVAAWLSLWDDRVRNRLQRVAPEVLIENGDPASLPIESRKSLIIGFAEHYAHHKHTGASFDITMIRRLADPQLASTVNDLLTKFETHDDVCTLLLKIIWKGQISDSVDGALSFAMNDQVQSYNRILAIRAIAAAGTLKQQRNLVKSLLTDISKLSPDILGEVCTSFFPKALSVPQLLKVLKKAKTPERYSASRLKQSIDEIAINTDIPEKEAKKLLQEFYKLLKSQPFIKRRHCEISQRYGWLLPSAIRLANQFIQKKHDFSIDPIAQELFLNFFIAQDYGDFYTSDREKLLRKAKAWPEFCHQLFWHAIGIARDREKDSKKHPIEWWQISWDIRNFWVPSTDNLERLFEDLSNKPELDDRSIALSAIFAVYVDKKRPRKLRERMKRAVAGIPELEEKMHELLHPKPLSEEQKKWRRQERDFKLRQKEREKHEKINRKEWQQVLRKKAKEVKNVGNAKKGEVWKRTAYLYDRIRKKKEEGEHGLGYSNWRALEDEFGFKVAKNFRDGCKAYWREYDPFTYPGRRTINTIPWPRIIGLTGLAMEAADDPDWAKKIDRDEAKIAARYSVCELSGFPSWFNELQSEFPNLVDEVIKNELEWELHESPAEQSSTHTLSALRYGNKELSERYKSIIFNLISDQEPANDFVIDHSLSIILTGQLDTHFKTKITKLAHKRFKATTENKRKYTWLNVLICVDGIKGCQLLKAWIKGLSSVKEKKETMVNFCAAIANHGAARSGYAIRDYERIEVLGELVPLIYKFVKGEDDYPLQTGVEYTPGVRDHAQQARSHLLNVIFDTPGRDSYDLLMNLSKIVSHSFFKDRMDYLAKERAAIDAEFDPWVGSAVAEFSLLPTKTPRSEADLYELALVRLDDLKLDIEDGDESEVVLLQKLTQETEVRTIFANRLRKSSRSLYTIGSEEELADATRTDIRFNAPQVSAPVPVELKIADKWTFRELLERLENQLIRQYMRVSRYGVYLLVHNGKKNRWKDSHTFKLVTFTELVEALKQNLDYLIKEHPNVAGLEIVGIDFTIR